MAIPTGGFLAQDVYDRALQGIIGGLVNTGGNATETLVNKDPEAKQVDTVVVDTATNNASYAFEIAGVTIAFTADASATKPEISAGLKLAFDADPVAGGLATVVDDGVDTLTITGNTPGSVYTVTDSDALLTTASVTAAAEADAVSFGRALASSGYDAIEKIKFGRVIKSTGFTVQVITIDYTNDTGPFIRVKVIDRHTGIVIADTQRVTTGTKATDTAALVVELNLLLPANSVIASAGGSDVLLLTAEVAGLEFDATVGTDNQADMATSLVRTTGPSPTTSILRAFVGISLYSEDEEATTVGGSVASYPANAGMRSLAKGEVWVENSQTIVYGDVVFVEMDGTGSDFGKFFNTDSATRLSLPEGMARWQRSSQSTDSLGHLRIDANNQPA